MKKINILLECPKEKKKLTTQHKNMEHENKMEKGKVYLVTLKSGVVFLGEFKNKQHGVVHIGGDLIFMQTGLFAEKCIDEIKEFPSVMPMESALSWIRRTGWELY
jgi:prefoldin subunit 5